MSDEDLYATKYDVGLSPNSICSIMHQFILGCDNLQWESDENLLKSIQMNVSSIVGSFIDEIMLEGDDTNR